METFLGIVVIVLAIAIIALVLCQDAKSEGLTGVISGSSNEGGAFGKQKSKQLQSVLSKATVVCSVLMLIAVILMLALEF